MTNRAPFYIATAFSNSPFGGNPAGIAFLDLDTPSDVLGGIARNLNQPMTAFISPNPLPSDDKTVARFGVRYFTPAGSENPLCGHATLAASRVVFSKDFVSEAVETIEFQTLTRGVVKAKKLEGGWFEIEFPSSAPQELSVEERAKIEPMFTKAFGRERVIKYMGKGGQGFENLLLVEIDEKEGLRECSVNPNELRETGFSINVVTAASSSNEDLFVSRMFAPTVLPDGEDHVCAVAHCVMGPYWYEKTKAPIGQEIKATQVSRRGGKLRVVWEGMDKIRLRGEVAVFANGDFVL